MKLPIQWLQDFVTYACSTDELAKSLTMAGLEVEDVINYTPEQLARLGGGSEPGAPDGLVFDVKVTPNRGDWLSVMGVAREAAAVLGAEFKISEPKAEGTPPPTSSAIKITIEAPDLCRRYAGGLVRNVKIKESPTWLKNRLIMAGMRPINNVVDITNYVMIELGQPLHAFDHSLLKCAEIIVRRARPGERMTTLDGQDRPLDPDMLVIADRDHAVAIAGVMGGYESEVGEQTKDILIESANFDPVSVRRTSKILGLTTESSYRFERSVDPSIAAFALKRAAELMRDLADGEIAEGIVDVYPAEIKPVTITLRPDRTNRLLGFNLSSGEMAHILQSLRMSVKTDQFLSVTVPTFRPDVTQEIDLIEEIARIHGFDKIEMTLPAAPSQGKQEDGGRFADRLRHILMRCGAQEVMTHSIVDPGMIERAGADGHALSIRNPLREDLSRLRTMLIPNLLEVLSRNAAFGARDLSVFEIGRVYHRAEDGSIAQDRSVAGAMIGSQWASAWNLDKSTLSADFYLCKGIVESLLDSLDIRGCEFAPAKSPLLHPTRAAVVKSAGVELGLLGEISPNLRESFEMRGRAYVFELDFEALKSLAVDKKIYRPLARYPAIYRDLSIVVETGAPYAKVKDLVAKTGGELIESVELGEVYAGPPLDPGQKSFLLSIAFRSAERTLTDQMVNDQLARIKDGLVEKLSAAIRGG
ncbi:MAG: phenylalanine--tRNA ligase subunit beta [Armatimonadota bacterium]|nr:phenylalanine--tRNA ligase subunit beta [Armatimonadota bacterium]